MRFLILISLFVLCSCGALQVLPVTVPVKPVYVVAGRDGAVGYGHTTISLINRENWQTMGNRNLTTSYIESGTHRMYGLALQVIPMKTNTSSRKSATTSPTKPTTSPVWSPALSIAITIR